MFKSKVKSPKIRRQPLFKKKKKKRKSFSNRSTSPILLAWV